MQHARMRVQSTGPVAGAGRLLRFEPVVHLVTGDVTCAAVQSTRRYEELAAFGASGLVGTQGLSLSLWSIEEQAVLRRRS